MRSMTQSTSQVWSIRRAGACIRRTCAGWSLLLAAAISLAAPVARAEVKVTAKISPNPVAVNQVANLTITVENGELQQLPEPNLPSPMGLAGGPSTSNQISIVNGLQTIMTEVVWPISSPKEGVMTIPPIKVQASGKSYSTREIKVEFTAASTAPKPKVPDGTEGHTNIDPILQLQMSKTEFYQGEVVPVTATLYIPNMIRLLRPGLIEVEKSDFAVQRFPQMGDQSTEMLGRVRYTTLTYHSTISALKPGKATIGPAKMEIIVEVPVGNNNGFGFGFIPMDRKKVVIEATEIPVNVLSLPAEGKPAGFGGAVGDFTLKATSPVQEAMVGDPVSVDLMVEGQGNFDALEAPKLTKPEGWKLYPPRRYNVDSTDPNNADLMNRGVGFATILVPEKVMPAVPPFEFSFFNPRSKTYSTLRSTPIALTIKPSDKVAAPVAAEAVGTAGSAKPAANPAPEADITDILVRLPAVSHWAVASVPLMEDTRFTVINALLCLSFVALIGGTLFKRWRQRQVLSEDQERRALLRQIEGPGLSEAEFYRRAAQYLHRYGSGSPPAAAGRLLEKYEKLNFAGPQAGAGPVDPADRAEALAVLKQLKAGVPVSSASPLATALLLVLLAGAVHGADVSPESRFQEASQALEKQDYKKAQLIGEGLVKDGQISAEVFTLLGHAAYKLGNPGVATIWYQRAQLFPSAIPELRQNLRHLGEKIHFFGFRRNEWLDFLAFLASRNQWALIATVGGWLALFSIAFLVLGARRPLRAWVVTTLVMGLLGMLLGALAWYARPDFRSLQNLVFVTANDATAHTAAAEISGHVIAVPAGSTMRRIEERGAWTYVEIPQPDENVYGWLLAKDLVPVWPYDPKMLP